MSTFPDSRCTEYSCRLWNTIKATDGQRNRQIVALDLSKRYKLPFAALPYTSLMVVERDECQMRCCVEVNIDR